ncbi:hypothetical protein, partial [Streptomyces olivaceus]|uniref:hypothetical protein n=1 Tax=Streptomyces olivaceus TaxID=47716 RepID=UPI0036657AC8
VYSGPLTRPLVSRVNLPDGKFWIVCGDGYLFLPGGKNSFAWRVRPLARPFLVDFAVVRYM